MSIPELCSWSFWQKVYQWMTEFGRGFEGGLELDNSKPFRVHVKNSSTYKIMAQLNTNFSMTTKGCMHYVTGRGILQPEQFTNRNNRKNNYRNGVRNMWNCGGWKEALWICGFESKRKEETENILKISCQSSSSYQSSSNWIGL